MSIVAIDHQKAAVAANDRDGSKQVAAKWKCPVSEDCEARDDPEQWRAPVTALRASRLRIRRHQAPNSR
jgi:hypothetical protein